MDNEEALREQSIKKLFKALLPFGNTTLPAIEQRLLKEVLINKKTFEELQKPLGIPIVTQEKLFNHALKHLNRILCDVSEKLHTNAYTILEKELAETKKKLESLERSAEQHDKLSPELKELLATPISQCDLPPRVQNICLFAEIKTVHDLVRYSRYDFKSFRNSGKRTCNDVEEFLEENGLSWEMQI